MLPQMLVRPPQQIGQHRGAEGGVEGREDTGPQQPTRQTVKELVDLPTIEAPHRQQCPPPVAGTPMNCYNHRVDDAVEPTEAIELALLVGPDRSSAHGINTRWRA